MGFSSMFFSLYSQLTEIFSSFLFLQFPTASLRSGSEEWVGCLTGGKEACLLILPKVNDQLMVLILAVCGSILSHWEDSAKRNDLKISFTIFFFLIKMKEEIKLPPVRTRSSSHSLIVCQKTGSVKGKIKFDLYCWVCLHTFLAKWCFLRSRRGPNNSNSVSGFMQSSLACQVTNIGSYSDTSFLLQLSHTNKIIRSARGLKGIICLR